MGVEQKDENLEIITTYNWDTDTAQSIETGKSELEKKENYERSSYFTYNTDTKAFEDKSIETQSTLIILAT